MITNHILINGEDLTQKLIDEGMTIWFDGSVSYGSVGHTLLFNASTPYNNQVAAWNWLVESEMVIGKHIFCEDDLHDDAELVSEFYEESIDDCQTLNESNHEHIQKEEQDPEYDGDF